MGRTTSHLIGNRLFLDVSNIAKRNNWIGIALGSLGFWLFPTVLTADEVGMTNKDKDC